VAVGEAAVVDPDRRYVAVVGGTVASDEMLEMAEQVGRRLGERGAVVVTGGRDGVAEAACRGAVAAGATTVGILPGRSRREANPFVTVAVPTGLGDTRNSLVVMGVDAVIAFPGGYGTLSEMAHALLNGKPVVALGPWPAELPVEGRDDVIRADDVDGAVELAMVL
jgi:uncharacterized protein (TIGR00725 family)